MSCWDVLEHIFIQEYNQKSRKWKSEVGAFLSMFLLSMVIQSCLDYIVNAHVRVAAEILLPRLSRLIVGMVLTARGVGAPVLRV